MLKLNSSELQTLINSLSMTIYNQKEHYRSVDIPIDFEYLLYLSELQTKLLYELSELTEL
jgi:hypothetical protein